jgi:hypothetical protein
MEILEILSMLVVFAIWFYGIGIAMEAMFLTGFAIRQPEIMLYLLEHPEAGKELSSFLDDPFAG